MSNLMMIPIIVLYSLQTLFCSLYTDRYPGRKGLASSVFCVLESIAIALITLVLNGFRFAVAPITLLLGVLNAGTLFGYNTSLIAASARGSYAFMNISMLFGGILVPMVYSACFLNEPIAWYQYVGIGLMLISFVLMNAGGLTLRGAQLPYYLFCLLLFFCNGIYGTLLKCQAVYKEEQNSEMLIITFGLMGVIALIQLIAQERRKTPQAFRMDRRAAAPLVLCLLSAALAANCLVWLLPMVQTAVFYTVENGGVLMLSAIYSTVIFKEKLTPLKVAGILLALVSITVLSLNNLLTLGAAA